MISDQTGFAAQQAMRETNEAGRTGFSGTNSTADTLAVQADPPAAGAGIDWGDFTTVFFAAGVVINLAMITAYIIWAFRQWSKQEASDE